MTAVTLVFDQATIGLMRGGLQLGRNIAFAVAKVAVLPATAIVLHDQFGVGITLSWVAGLALSLTLVAIRLRLRGEPVLPRPDWGVLRGLGRSAMAHNWLNLAMTMPFYLLPVLVTVIVSPTANAAFYIAVMLTTFLFIVPAHLSTVLFAVVAADPGMVARKLRFALRVSFLIGLPGMAALILGAHLALGLFGHGLHGGHGADVAGHPGLPGGGPEVPLHRRLPGIRPGTPARPPFSAPAPPWRWPRRRRAGRSAGCSGCRWRCWPYGTPRRS